jgi:hypothetical protein
MKSVKGLKSAKGVKGRQQAKLSAAASAAQYQRSPRVVLRGSQEAGQIPISRSECCQSPPEGMQELVSISLAVILE